jgi:hypothetical protein
MWIERIWIVILRLRYAIEQGLGNKLFDKNEKTCAARRGTAQERVISARFRLRTWQYPSIWRQGKAGRELVLRFPLARVNAAGLEGTSVLDRVARSEINGK